MKKAFLVPILFMFLLAYSEAARHISVTGLRHSASNGHTRIVVDIGGPIDYTQQRISNPDRVFFDLKNCLLSGNIPSSFPVNDGILKKVRMAQFNKNTVRVVLDIDKLEKYYAFVLEDPNRLVIDAYDDGSRPKAKVKDKRQVLVDHGLREIKTVVIDPGHGGRDPGAIGPGGLREKDITLSVGKKLGKMLKAKHGVDIVYTRDRDKYVPLNDRTEIANSRKADLFVSIHTNASRKRSVRGIETYFLNWSNDWEAMKVAARENKVSIKKMQKIRGDLNSILDDLNRKFKNEESMRLAHSVQNSMVNTLQKKYGKIENLGVKYAWFYVLIGAEMPSILVEISFISNHEEERRLASNSYKNKVAEAIAIGIDNYIAQSTLIVRPVKKNISEG